MPPVPQQHWQLAAQQPTCTNLRIRSVEDAHKVFYAVRKGILRMVTRRLDADERMALRTGCCYAWEERNPNTEITGLGIERFTEGRRWSPSRVRDEFLFYYEKFVPPDNQRGTSSSEPVGWDQLVKQTYSVWVDTGKGRRKWHLTTYFTQATVDQLGTVDDIEDVRKLQVPAGMFTSTRVGKRKNTDADGASQPTVTRVYAPFPSPLPPLAPRPAKTVPTLTSLIGRAPSPSVQMYEPYSRPQSQAQATYYSSDEHQVYSSFPSTSQRPRLNYIYSSLENLPLSPAARPLHGFPHQDDDDEDVVMLEHPPGPTSAQHYSGSPPQHTSSGTFTTTYRARVRTPPYASTTHSQDQSPPQQGSGGWYTSPMVTYPPPQGSPRSDHTSSSSSHASSSPHTTSYPLCSPELLVYSPASGGGSSRSLPRLQLPADPSPAILVAQIDAAADPERRAGGIGPCRDLAPLNSLLTRVHPYRRDPTDDRALRRLARPSP
ncbi:hypothetical protein B0H11DRAFT_2075489 [Mycena galericulata]|nr:hypothetical protein B0H11DRAFT_2075489 [Mycena galericulata]